MSDVAHPEHTQLRLGDKLLSLGVWLGAGALFASVGWMAVQPDDPQGAVSLLTRSGSLWSLVQIVALATVVSALAAALVGRKLPDAGVFAVAVGLSAAVWRGESTAHLLISVAGDDAAARGSLAWRLAFEGLIWFLPIAAAILAGGLVVRWLHGAGSGDPTDPRRAMALVNVPGMSGWIVSADQQEDRPGAWGGVKTMLVSLLAAAIIFRILATGSPLRSVQQGQSFFALAAAFYLGGLLAYEIFPARTALWGILSAPLLCLLGYFVAALSSSPGGGYGQIASVPPSTFYRSLPAEYVCVGTAASIAAFWSVRRSAMLRSRD